SPRADAVVAVQGGVLGEFRGRPGTYRAGRLPAGTYEIRGFFDGAWVVQPDALYVTPGEQVTVKCSNALMKCWVVK
ncbi:MAG: hypothetical protein ABMA64_43120, partial [Myxococcota bacterium]